MDRVVLVAQLKDGARGRAERLLTSEIRANAPEDAFERGTIFLTDSEVIFLLEGPDAAAASRAILNDPVRSTVIEPWIPLFAGPLHWAREAYSWVS